MLCPVTRMLGSFRVIVLVAIALAAGVLWLIRPEPPMGGDTPEELLAALGRAWREPDRRDDAWVGQRMTHVGRVLWGRVKMDPPPQLPVVTQWAGLCLDGHYEIHHQVADARLVWTFWYEAGAWRFHDIYIFELGGARWDMPLSLVARDPAQAAGRLAVQNPGPPWQVVVGGLELPAASQALPPLRALRLAP